MILYHDLAQQFKEEYTGCSVVRSSRMVWDHEVAGSNPATPTFFQDSFFKKRATGFLTEVP